VPFVRLGQAAHGAEALFARDARPELVEIRHTRALVFSALAAHLKEHQMNPHLMNI